MKFVRVGAALLLAGALLSGCANETEAAPQPEPDPEVAYCEAYRDYFERSIDRDATDAERIASMKTFVRDLDGLELPEMDADVARGLEVWSEMIEEAPENATEADMMAMEAELSPSQGADIRAFLDWNTANC